MFFADGADASQASGLNMYLYDVGRNFDFCVCLMSSSVVPAGPRLSSVRSRPWSPQAFPGCLGRSRSHVVLGLPGSLEVVRVGPVRSGSQTVPGPPGSSQVALDFQILAQFLLHRLVNKGGGWLICCKSPPYIFKVHQDGL